MERVKTKKTGLEAVGKPLWEIMGNAAWLKENPIQAKWNTAQDGVLRWDQEIMVKGFRYLLYKEGDLYRCELAQGQRLSDEEIRSLPLGRLMTKEELRSEWRIDMDQYEEEEEEQPLSLPVPVLEPVDKRAGVPQKPGKLNEHEDLEAARVKLEEHFKKPGLSWNMRGAVRQAERISAAGDAACRSAAVRRLDDLVKKGKIRLPDASWNSERLYGGLVKYLQTAPVTINFHTSDALSILGSGSLLNMWERGSRDPSKKTYWGGGEYASSRSRTEMALHGLPPMAAIGEAGMELGSYAVEKGQRDKDFQITIEMYQEQLDQHRRRLAELEAAGVQAASTKEYKALASIIPMLEQKLAQQLHSRYQKQLGVTEKDDPTASLPADRPHSAAINAGFRAGEAYNPGYGASHLVLKQEVKERSTLTAGDSLEKTFNKGRGPMAQGVSSFSHPGAVLTDIAEDTLVQISETILHPGEMRRKPPVSSQMDNASPQYFEVQIFGSVQLSRDVERVVIDESDLEYWERGEFMDFYHPETPLPPCPRQKLKEMIEEKASELGIQVAYIKTGKNRPGGGKRGMGIAGEDLSAYIQPYETETEQMLKTVISSPPGAEISLHLSNLVDRINPDILTGTGLEPIYIFVNSLRTELASGKKINLNVAAKQLLDQFYKTPVLHEKEAVFMEFWQFVMTQILKMVSI